MGLIRNVQIMAAVAVFAATGVSCFAQQQQNTQDPYNPQNMRLPNQLTNPPMNSGLPGSPNNVTSNLLDFGSGTDQGNIGVFVTPADREFATMTASRALTELQLSRAALDKASSEGVRKLAHRMIDDYSKWSNSVNRISERLNIAVATKIDAKHKAEVDKIVALSGVDFDRAYLREMVHLQNKALTITHYEAENAGVTRLRNWAGIMIPTIQEELKMAKQEQSGGAIVSRK